MQAVTCLLILIGLCASVQETEEELQPGLVLRLAVMSRQHCHTQSHTALMLWQAARPLAQLLLRCPATLQCALRCWSVMCFCVAFCMPH